MKYHYLWLAYSKFYAGCAGGPEGHKKISCMETARGCVWFRNVDTGQLRETLYHRAQLWPFTQHDGSYHLLITHLIWQLTTSHLRAADIRGNIELKKPHSSLWRPQSMQKLVLSRPTSLQLLSFWRGHVGFDCLGNKQIDVYPAAFHKSAILYFEWSQRIQTPLTLLLLQCHCCSMI